MQHAQRIADIKAGRLFSPELAINDSIEGLVHCALIVRAHEDGTLLTPEVRALDAVGVQVERELRNRAEMIRALNDRVGVLAAELTEAQEFVRDRARENNREAVPPQFRTQEDRMEPREMAIMPEQHGGSKTV